MDSRPDGPPRRFGAVIDGAVRVGAVGRRRVRRVMRPGALSARLTAGRRAVPAALIVGAQRAGTTALTNWLGQHPQIFLGRRKEIHYFDQRRLRSEGWYRAQFPTVEEVAAIDGVVLDATPSYMWRPYAVERMATLLPTARLIVSLREPVDRALSQFAAYQQWRMARPDPGPVSSFDQAVAEALAWFDDPTNQRELDTSGAPLTAALLDRGRYAHQLERLLRFYPRDQVLVLKAEDTFADPEPAYHRVLDHLGLDRIDLPSYGAANASVSDATMTPETRTRLTEFFRPDLDRLPEVLDQDIGW